MLINIEHGRFWLGGEVAPPSRVAWLALGVQFTLPPVRVVVVGVLCLSQYIELYSNFHAPGAK